MKLSENAETVLSKRYYLPDEDWHGLCKRVSDAVGKDDERRSLYFDAINNLYFLPNSPTLMNAGTNLPNLSACMVLPLDDSMDSIMDTAKNMALVFKSGGGVGISFDNIREKDAKVSETSGVASGVVSFMELYNSVANCVKQGGKRRAALMGSLRVDHPEILNFIDCKLEKNKLNNFNISVCVTDKFMKSAENGEEYELVSPVNGVVGKLNARDVLLRIAENAHENGEPGLLFIDAANKYNPIPQFGKYKTTNPCFAGNERLLTRGGYVSFDSLYSDFGGSEIYIVNNNGVEERARIIKNGEKDTIELKLSDRSTICCTKDHVFFSDGQETMAIDMLKKYIDAPMKLSFEDYSSLYEFYGFIQGDGNLSRLNSAHHVGLEINIGKKDLDIIEYFNNSHSKVPELKMKNGERKIYLKDFNKTICDVGFSDKILPERLMPKWFSIWSKNQQMSFVRGCYSANGSIISKHRIAYKSTCLGFLEQLKEYLLSIGIESYITTNKPKSTKFSNGEYVCRESYDLNITKIKSIIEFAMKIGFIQKYKTEMLSELLHHRRMKVTSIRNSGRKDVYDFACENHIGVVEHCVVHNCGEVYLLENEACNLLSLNMVQVIDNLEYYVRLSVRFLNDVIDAGKYPLPQIHEQVKKTRKIGLGIMGWADYLALQKIPYDSKTARKMAEDIEAQIYEYANDESLKIAVEKNEFIDTVDGLRYNGTLLTIAPTGTISMIADCSSSIEPYFALAYTKNVMDGHSLKYVNPILLQVLEDEGLWCPEVKAQVIKTGSIQNIDIIPQSIKDVFKTANEISISGHVKMQAAFQKYVDNSISKTINLQSDATVNDVLLAYVMAYNEGCKGITVYRDGSRSGQVLTTSKSKIDKCPECKTKLSHNEGCATCPSCGWSLCTI